jgi:hypothetical protein
MIKCSFVKDYRSTGDKNPTSPEIYEFILDYICNHPTIQELFVNIVLSDRLSGPVSYLALVKL